MNPWDRRPDEPPEWHQRFIAYCGLGPLRSLEQSWHLDALARGAAARSGRSQVPARWRAAARRYCWEERAAAWDAYETDRALLPEEHRRTLARRRRLQLIQRILALSMRALDAADMPDLERDEARALLPVVRHVLRDMLTAERAEYAARPETGDAPVLAPFTADELAQAEAEVRRVLEQNQTGLSPAGTAPDDSPSLPRLLVCIGPDPALAVDLAMLRAVKRETGLAIHRISNATRAKLEAALRRERSHGRAVPYLHLACHAGPQGVEFADGLADGDWLSARLAGVQVLLIAACDGATVGDWLAVVPYVITFDDEISHGDAATLAHHFWRAIGSGANPAAALDAALSRTSSVVGEFVVRHW